MSEFKKRDAGDKNGFDQIPWTADNMNANLGDQSTV